MKAISDLLALMQMHELTSVKSILNTENPNKLKQIEDIYNLKERLVEEKAEKIRKEVEENFRRIEKL